MDQAVVLLSLRLLSALALLAFVGFLGWFSYVDMKAVTRPAHSTQMPSAYLEVLDSVGSQPPAGTNLPLAPVTTIGRSLNSTIVLSDDYASGDHALLSFHGDHWLLEDRRSRNGTLLNDQPLTDPVVVRPGDIITIGDTRLKLVT